MAEIPHPSIDLDDRDARYLSCRFIEGELYLFHDFVKFCCVGRQGGLRAPRIPRSGAQPPDMEVVERERLRLREANNGSDPPCMGCPHLTRDLWNRKRDRHFLRALGVASSLACNLKCDYCDQVRQLATNPELAALGRTTPAYEPLLAGVVQEGWLAPKGRVTLSGGEPVLVRDFEQTLRMLFGRGLRVSVLTNATVFSPVLYELLALRTKRVRVLTSIDCGTPELYKAMKGKDLFFRALGNLGAYARSGGSVTAKYIVSSNNTAEREFVEFARHLRREGIRRAAISINTDPATRFPATGPDSPLEAMSRLRDALWHQGIRVRMMDFGVKNRGMCAPRRDGLGRRLWRWWGRWRVDAVAELELDGGRGRG